MNHEQLNTSGRFSSVFWSYSINIFIPTLLFKGIYSGDLNSKLIRYSDQVDFLLVEWFAAQMHSTMDVQYSDHHLIYGLVFRPPFENQSKIQMPGSMVPGIWIANHLNNGNLTGEQGSNI